MPNSGNLRKEEFSVVIVYVSSLKRGSCKTSIIAGLGKYLQNEEKKVGYYKPVINQEPDIAGNGDDSDAVFFQKLFRSVESIIHPVFISDMQNSIGHNIWPFFFRDGC